MAEIDGGLSVETDNNKESRVFRWYDKNWNPKPEIVNYIDRVLDEFNPGELRGLVLILSSATFDQEDTRRQVEEGTPVGKALYTIARRLYDVE